MGFFDDETINSIIKNYDEIYRLVLIGNLREKKTKKSLHISRHDHWLCSINCFSFQLYNDGNNNFATQKSVYERRNKHNTQCPCVCFFLFSSSLFIVFSNEQWRLQCMSMSNVSLRFPFFLRIYSVSRFLIKHNWIFYLRFLSSFCLFTKDQNEIWNWFWFEILSENSQRVRVFSR